MTRTGHCTMFWSTVCHCLCVWIICLRHANCCDLSLYSPPKPITLLHGAEDNMNPTRFVQLWGKFCLAPVSTDMLLSVQSHSAVFFLWADIVNDITHLFSCMAELLLLHCTINLFLQHAPFYPCLFLLPLSLFLLTGKDKVAPVLTMKQCGDNSAIP